MFFLSKLNIHITNHVIGEVITDIKAFDITVFREFFKEVFIELLKMILDLARFDRLAVNVDAGSYHIGTLVHVGEKNGRADTRFRVEP